MDTTDALTRVRSGRNPLYTTTRIEPELQPAPPGVCEAETFDGVDRRRCSRPARWLRDDFAVCHQHGRLEHVREWRPAVEPLTPEGELPTEADILDRFSEQYRLAMYGSALAMAGADYRIAASAPILRQSDRDQPVRDDFGAVVTRLARSAAFALADLGLTDEEIMGRMRTAISRG